MNVLVRGFTALILLLFGLFPSAPARAQTLQVRPPTLDLGAVKLGGHAVGEVFLENPGSKDLEVLVRVAGEYFAASPETLHLASHAEEAIDIEFRAPAAGEHQGELTLQVKTFFKTESFAVPLRAQVKRAGLDIAPDPTEGLDLGALQVGQKTHRPIVLTNPSSVPLVIDSLFLAVAGTPFQLSTTGAFELSPGQEKAIPVVFQPTEGGTYQNRLIIHSADLDPQRLELDLKGEALAPRAAFSPLPEVGLDFDHLEIGQRRTRYLTILNQGRADLLVEGVETSGGAFASAWDSTAALPIPPGERQQIGVDFRPRYEGRASGKIYLRTNDPESSSMEILLLGVARVSPPVIEILNSKIIDFGSVAIGKEERDHLLLWNRGGTPYTVHLDNQTEVMGEFEIESPAVLLQPGEYKKVSLKFNPRETGERRAALRVETESGHRQISLYGIGKYLALSPTTVDFDRVIVGKSSNQQIELLNIGNADFTVTNIRSSNPKSFAVNSQVSPATKFVLSANGLHSLPVSVTFSPAARGVVSGVLQLEGYWDEAFETREILLNGTGVAADLELHPSGPFDFDYIVLGEREARTLVATNTGDTDLRVESHPETPEASVEPSSFALKPGESTTLQLVFAPGALGNRAGRIQLISNDVKERALPLQIKGKGALPNIDLVQVISILTSHKARMDTLEVGWNNTPVILKDQSKIDVVFHIEDALRQALVGRKFNIAWTQLDANYGEQGGPKQTEVQIHDSGEGHLLVEKLNLRLVEKSNRRVRLTISTSNHPGAPLQKVSQVFEAGGWKWEFEAKPLVSFLSIRPGRDYVDKSGNPVKGQTERLVGLPGFAFFGFHNSENPSISGVHLTAIGNVLEALSTENSIAVSLGLAVSMYKDRFMFGLGWDIYDHRPKDKRKATQDYIMSFKYWGLF